MRHLNFTLFDEYCVVPSTGLPAFTSSDHYNRLGQWDQLVYHIVIDNQNNTLAGTITVVVEMSTDGRNWVAKASSLTLLKEDGSSSGGVVGGSGGGTVQLWGVDTGSTPSMAFVRLRFTFGASGVTGAHVRIHATARDEK